LNESKPKEMTLKALAAETGVSERTIRFYISRGLVEPPLRAGRSAAYGETHKERLEAIRRLQAMGMTLAEIAHALASAGALDPGAKTGEARGGSLSQGGARPAGGDEANRMLWFDIDGNVDDDPTEGPKGSTLAAKDGGIGPSASSGPIDAAIADPETWRSYQVAADVRVMFRTGASPWRAKRLLSALRRFADEVVDRSGT
jgi:DNA-binding transcriptional MerR regulator